MGHTVEEHFEEKSPVVREIYDTIVAAAGEFGYVAEDPKKTLIHLNRNSAFAGIQTQRDSIVLTIKSTNDIDSDRIRQKQQASADRWYCYIKLSSPDDIDAELIGWLRGSYDISG